MLAKQSNNKMVKTTLAESPKKKNLIADIFGSDNEEEQANGDNDEQPLEAEAEELPKNAEVEAKADELYFCCC